MSQDSELIELGPDCREYYFCGDRYPRLEALGVPVAGLSELQGHYRVRRRMPQHLMQLSLAGEGWGGAPGERQSLPAGSVFLVPAQSAYEVGIQGGDPWQTAWALLEPAHWRDFPDRLTVLADGDVAAFAPLLHLLHQARFQGDLGAQELRHSLAQALVSALRRLLPAHRTAGATPAVLQALFAEVEAQPAGDWSAAQLAERLACSRSQLHRRCVAAFGRGPAAQVEAIRMQQAQYWVRASQLPLQVIGERLGYANPYHFSTAFKRHCGRAPSFYRRDGL